VGRLRAAFALLVCTAFAEDPHIGTIDFYGYRSLDLAQLRAALPYHVGDPVPPRQARSEVEKTYAKAVGRARAAITAICCLPDGRTSLFVGLEDPAAPMLTFHPKPAGSAKLPPEVLQLYRDMDRLNEIAVKSGHAGEDDSHGYSLSNYPPQRALELMLRDYARAHTATLYRVLENCPDDESRAAAAEALGYADESKRQIAGLVRASLDPNDDVRNNAIRALGVLVEFDPKALRLVPLKPYIALIHSIDWFDRNKTVFLWNPSPTRAIPGCSARCAPSRSLRCVRSHPGTTRATASRRFTSWAAWPVSAKSASWNCRPGAISRRSWMNSAENTPRGYLPRSPSRRRPISLSLVAQ